MRLALTAAAALGLTACAGYSRVTEYPAHLPRNYTVVHISGGRVFTVKEHPRDTTIMIQPTIGRAAVAGLVGSVTGSVSTAAAIEPQYREAAEKWATEHHCTVDRLYPIETVSWEATLKCPPGDGWR
jgi:hypothetical protein